MSATISSWRLPLLAAGFIIWSLAFVVLYASLSVGCSFGWDRVNLLGGLSLQRAQLIILFVVHFAAGLALAAALRREFHRLRSQEVGAFLGAVAFYVALAAVTSTGFTFFGILFLSTCL